MTAVTLRGNLNRPLTNAEMDANFINLNEELATKESAITAATTAATAKYWRGDKTWRDFFTDVRAATLTGLSTATDSVVAATDTVLAAIGKLQAQVSTKYDKGGGSIGGTVNFTGPARRITGDFSDATVSKRLLFQTNVGNGNTTVGAVPNGSGGTSGFAAYAKADVANSEVLTAYATAISSVVAATKTGSGNFTPLLLLAGGLERLHIDPTTGNVLAKSGALGYGVGAGGTVVQAASKSTAVTLNKPSGCIITSNSALAADRTAVFRFNNSSVSADGSEVLLFTVVGHDANKYAVAGSVVAPGVCSVSIKNIIGGSFSEAVSINFAVIKVARS